MLVRNFLLGLFSVIFGFLKADAQQVGVVGLNRFIDTSIQNGGHMQTRLADTTSVSFKVGNFNHYLIKEFHFQPIEFYYSLFQKGIIDGPTLKVHEERFKEKGGNICND